MSGSAADPSPLGRYDPSGGNEDLHEVRLLRLPVRVLAAGREHHDELMREFAILSVAETEPRDDVPERLLELIAVLGDTYGRTAERPDAEVDAALAAGRDSVDLTYLVPHHVVDAAGRLAGLMAEADEFCRAEQMLTLQRPALQVAFADWYLGEFRRQLAGEPPLPWPGPLDVEPG